jgi:protein gp37
MAFERSILLVSFGVMASCPQHTFQVLTKRADRMQAWFAQTATHPTLRHPNAMADHAAYLGEIRGREADAINALYRREVAWPLPNVHVGVSVENRKHGLPRIDHLRRVPAAVRFLSVEPLLEDLGAIDLTGIHWVIAGVESGPGARPMNEDWVRSIRDQCAASGVPFFYKQKLDENGRKVSLPLLDGVRHDAMPAVSR